MMALRSAATETGQANRGAVVAHSIRLQAEADRLCELWETLERAAF
jgi:hypothetical protein